MMTNRKRCEFSVHKAGRPRGEGLSCLWVPSPPPAGQGSGIAPPETNRKGFTLVELLVVMVIIALLAALVGPRLFPKLGKGKQSACSAQIELIGQGLDHFRLDVGRYPTTQEGLNALMVNTGIEKWDGPYLKKAVPTDPWGKPFHYQCPGSHGEYDLFSYGRDGTSGGEGEDRDVTSWE
ncbi:MAG: type II secretion system major pseudopilin GspG [Thermodesulfobacteriota bacterium]